MKKYLLLLLVFTRFLGYSQTTEAKVSGLSEGSRTVTFKNPDPIEINGTPSIIPATGFNEPNGKIVITFKGGSDNYNYILTKKGVTPITPIPELTGLMAGDYILIAEDKESGCKSEPYEFTIKQPEKLLVTITTGTAIQCPNETATLIVTDTQGGTETIGYKYEWFKDNGTTFVTTNLEGKSANGLGAGTYKVKVIDNALPVNTAWSDPIVITSIPAINVSETHTNVTCNDSSNGTISLTINGGTAGYKILWSDAITTTHVAGQPDRTGLIPRNYFYTITDANGCEYYSAEDIIITAPPAVSITSLTTTQPSGTNSTDGKITITASGGTGTYTYFITKGGITTPYNTNIINNLENGTYEVIVKDSNNCTSLASVAKLEALAVNLVSQQNVKCFGENTGSITVLATGGTLAGNSDYKYEWYKDLSPLTGENSPELKNIGNGSYTVKVTDDKNTTVTSVIYTISQPDTSLTATATSTDVICNGESNGTITLNIQGGTTPYNVAWQDVNDTARAINPTQLIAGTYSYLITDKNGCTFPSPKNITINQNNVTEIISTGQKQPTSFSANDGEIIINATGGTNTYTYILKKNNITTTEYPTTPVTGLGEGIYEVSVKDSKGCTTAIQTINLKALAVALVNKTDVTCYGANTGSIEVHATGGTPAPAPNQYTYVWFYKQKTADPYTLLASQTTNKAENLYAGFYKVVVTDNASVSRELVITELTQRPAIACIATKTNVNCFSGNDGTITLNITGGTGAYTVAWKDVNDNSKTVNPIQLTAGSYTYTITDANGCTFPGTIIEITQPLKALNISSFTKIDANGFDRENGSIAIVASDGTGPYTYQWYKGAAKTIMAGKTSALLDAIGADSYTVIVKDKNLCPLEQTYTILQPNKLEVVSLTQSSFSDIACKGNLSGEYTMIVQGGVKEYSFEWINITTGTKYTSTEIISATSTSSKASGLGAGSYVVTVKDLNNNILFGTNTFTITEPDQLAFTYTKENVSCFGGNNGTIKLNITGGTKDSNLSKPYSIISSGGTVDYKNGIISGLSEGTYTIKVTDINLCGPVEETIQITQPAKSVIIEDNAIVTPTTGFGLSTGKIEISAVGGTVPYIYEWKNSAGSIVGTNSAVLSNAPADTYTVIVRDSNLCFDSKTYIIEQPTKPALTETHQQPKCYGLLGSIQATANGGAAYNQIQTSRIYNYKLKNKATAAITTINGNTANFTNLADGDYTLTATDVSGIESNSIDIQLKQPAPIVVSVASKSNVKCFGDKDGAIALSVSGGTPLMINGTPEYKYQWKKKNLSTTLYENFTPTSLNAFTAGIYAIEVRDENFDASDASHCIGILEDIEITQPADFGFDIEKITYTNPTAINGNDGALHFEITGGKANYDYKFYTKNAAGTETIIQTIPNSTLMTADFSGLTKDHYYISVQDATGCIKYADFDFRDNPLTISINQTQNISCYDANNGIIKANATGGFGQKKYSWYHNTILLANETEDMLLNVKPGNYYVIVKDSKKVEVTSNSISITQPDPVTFSTSQEAVKCLGDSNGKITLSASGGNGTFRYRYSSNNILIKDWQNFSNGKTTIISDLAEAEYTIQVQDTQQCKSVDAIVKITSPSGLTISKTTITPATGKGLSNGSIAITAQGANGQYSYQWYKGDNTSANQTVSTAINLAAGKYYVIVSDSKGCNLTSPLLEVTEPPLLETIISVQNGISCNGDKNGSLKTTTTGGFLNSNDNYTYQWFENGNPTSLASTMILTGRGKGSYYAIVTDSNGNKATSQILTLTEPALLTSFLTSDYVLCGDLNDWTVNATTSGGTEPYNYSWNTGAKTASIQNVPPGNYSVSISDSNGCKITKTILLTAPAHLDATENIKIPTCYNGSDATIVVAPVAGIAPYTYSWNTGEKTNTLRNASAGNYTVEITDSKGCLISKNYTIENPPKDVIDLGGDVTLCFDQTLTINAAIADDQATYSWKSDKGFTSNKAMITVSEPANYTVTVTNKLGCEATDTIQVFRQNTAISAEFAMSSQVFKNEKIVIVDISNPAADEIEWVLPANANVVTKNKDYAEISFSEIGEYEITLNTKKGNCTAFQTKQILVTEGEYEENPDEDPVSEKKFDLKIYPNPSQGIFTVDVMLDKVMTAHVKVYNLNNNLLIDSKTEEGKDNYLFNFNLGGLPPGLYFVLFESQQGSKLRKIIIQ